MPSSEQCSTASIGRKYRALIEFVPIFLYEHHYLISTRAGVVVGLVDAATVSRQQDSTYGYCRVPGIVCSAQYGSVDGESNSYLLYVTGTQR